MGRLLGYPQLALAARLHDGAWWELDTWHPRCDPRIPLRPREPGRSVGCSPGEARIPWVRNAIKWHLSVLLESGALTWSTLTNQRSQALLRFARWLESLPDPAAAVADRPQAVFAADFRRWAADPAHRSSASRQPAEVSARKVNLDLLSVAGLMDFLAAHRSEAARILGPSPWNELTDAHPAIWLRQRTRMRRREPLSDETRYVDDHALAQITACLPVLGAGRAGGDRYLRRQHANAARPGRPPADADAAAADPHRPPRQRDLPVSLRLPVPGHRQRRRRRGRRGRRPLPLRPEQDRRRTGHHLRRRRGRRGHRRTAAVAARPVPATTCPTCSRSGARTRTPPSTTAAPTTAGPWRCSASWPRSPTPPGSRSSSATPTASGTPGSPSSPS